MRQRNLEASPGSMLEWLALVSLILGGLFVFADVAGAEEESAAPAPMEEIIVVGRRPVFELATPEDWQPEPIAFEIAATPAAEIDELEAKPHPTF